MSVGVLSYDELRTGLDSMGIILSESEFSHVVNAFDADHAGEIDYDHFADAVAGDAPTYKRVSRFQGKVSDTYRSSIGESLSPATPATAAASTPTRTSLVAAGGTVFASADVAAATPAASSQAGDVAVSPPRRRNTLSDVTARSLLQRLRDKVTALLVPSVVVCLMNVSHFHCF